jgi:hypothetical protein
VATTTCRPSSDECGHATACLAYPFADDRCRPIGADGDPCIFATPSGCADGLVCTPEARQLELSPRYPPVTGSCRAPIDVGRPCTHDDGFVPDPCGPFAQCTGGVCTALPSAGAPCDGVPPDCAEGLHCELGTCTADGVGAGASCDPLTRVGCSPGFFCVAASTTAPGTCAAVEARADGASCAHDQECASARCIGSACAVRGASGASCATTGACQTGLYCATEATQVCRPQSTDACVFTMPSCIDPGAWCAPVMRCCAF